MVLMAGFGGLLLLTALAGADGIKALEDIERSSDRIRDDFQLRTRVLERIRTDLYRSGTDVRDYLLEPEPGKAEGHRYTLLETRRDMDDALERYRNLLSSSEVQPFAVLTKELAEYWGVLEPTFVWNARERQHAGYPFLRDEVFPRRSSILAIASQIGGLNEAQLDAGKLVIRETFASFRRRLIGAIALTIGLGFLLAWFGIRSILKLESVAAGHYREISQLSARLLEAQEEERRAISRELHDEVGQSLSGVLLEMANLSKQIRGAEAAERQAEDIKRLVEGVMRNVRNMALLLRPSMLDDLGLAPALQWQAREASRHSPVTVHVAADDVPDDLPEGHRTCVYRVVQEALHNIVRHSQAREAQIAVKQESGRLLLSIHDDGRGFDPQKQRGMGLIGMQERVGALGGKLTIDSAVGKGTLLRVELPA
jgi:signal transduction histidine kinase